MARFLMWFKSTISYWTRCETISFELETGYNGHFEERSLRLYSKAERLCCTVAKRLLNPHPSNWQEYSEEMHSIPPFLDSELIARPLMRDPRSDLGFSRIAVDQLIRQTEYLTSSDYIGAW
jgi:hypothetical protein